MSNVSHRELDPLRERLGLPEQSEHFLEAVSHPSYANERGSSVHNQRLEFLGDAVLDWIVTELLFVRYPHFNEGALTRIRSQLVSTEALAEWAREQKLTEWLLLGRGAEAGGLRDSDNVLADFVEALIAAVYLDVGPAAARGLCEQIVARRLALMSEGGGLDPKTELQQRVQALGLPAPTYEVTASGGPAHSRWFTVRVRLGDGSGASATGRSKRLAEREAARLTLADDSWRAVHSAAGQSE